MIVIFTGVISSIIATLVYALVSFFIRPNIETSKVMCVTKENGEVIYRVKIVNKTRARLMNVFYSLDYCEDTGDDRSFLTDIPTRKGIVTTIEKCNNKTTDYAVRVSFKIDETKFPLKDNTRFIFTITATHPFSNTSVCKKTVYKKDDIVRDAVFQTGKSMNFLIENVSAAPNQATLQTIS